MEGAWKINKVLGGRPQVPNGIPLMSTNLPQQTRMNNVHYSYTNAVQVQIGNVCRVVTRHCIQTDILLCVICIIIDIHAMGLCMCKDKARAMYS